MTAGASLTYRIRLAIARGIRTEEAIAEELDAKRKTVQRLLRRLRKDGKAKETDARWEPIT